MSGPPGGIAAERLGSRRDATPQAELVSGLDAHRFGARGTFDLRKFGTSCLTAKVIRPATGFRGLAGRRSYVPFGLRRI
jgi:hypothetical protein